MSDLDYCAARFGETDTAVMERENDLRPRPEDGLDAELDGATADELQAAYVSADWCELCDAVSSHAGDVRLNDLRDDLSAHLFRCRYKLQREKERP